MTRDSRSSSRIPSIAYLATAVLQNRDRPTLKSLAFPQGLDSAGHKYTVRFQEFKDSLNALWQEKFVSS